MVFGEHYWSPFSGDRYEGEQSVVYMWDDDGISDQAVVGAGVSLYCAGVRHGDRGTSSRRGV